MNWFGVAGLQITLYSPTKTKMNRSNNSRSNFNNFNNSRARANNSSSNSSSNSRSRALEKFCGVCHRAGRTEAEYRSHFPRQTSHPDSPLVCPILLAMKCFGCGKCGHIRKNCPMASSEQQRPPMHPSPPIRPTPKTNSGFTKTTKTRFEAAFGGDGDPDADGSHPVAQKCPAAPRPAAASVTAHPMNFMSALRNKTEENIPGPPLAPAAAAAAASTAAAPVPPMPDMKVIAAVATVVPVPPTIPSVIIATPKPAVLANPKSVPKRTINAIRSKPISWADAESFSEDDSDDEFAYGPDIDIRNPPSRPIKIVGGAEDEDSDAEIDEYKHNLAFRTMLPTPYGRQYIL